MSSPNTPEPIVQVKAGRSRAASSGSTRSGSSGSGSRPGPRLKAERPRSQWPLVVYGLLAVLVLAAGALLLLRPRQNVYVLRSYEAATVLRADLTETETVVGTLTSGDVRPVSAATEGTVQQLLVQPGQDVTAGQLLLRLSSPALEAARLKARDALLTAQTTQRSALRTAQSALNEAQRAEKSAATALPTLRLALRSAQQLYALGGVSRLDLQTAQLKLQDAERAQQDAGSKTRDAAATVQDAQLSGAQRLQVARDDLKQAETALSDLDLKSPIAGRVSDLNLKVGQRLTLGSVALNVASLQDVSVGLQLGETLAGRVQVGQAAQITTGGTTSPGKITRVAAQANAGGQAGGSASPTVQAEAAFEKLPSGLRLGSSASVEVKVATHPGVPILPRAAFLSTGGEALAYVLTGDRAERREVGYGAQNDTQVEVRSGLKLGERVIVSSYESFKDQPSIQAPKSGELSGNDSSNPTPGGTP